MNNDNVNSNVLNRFSTLNGFISGQTIQRVMEIQHNVAMNVFDATPNLKLLYSVRKIELWYIYYSQNLNNVMTSVKYIEFNITHM